MNLFKQARKLSCVERCCLRIHSHKNIFSGGRNLPNIAAQSQDLKKEQTQTCNKTFGTEKTTLKQTNTFKKMRREYLESASCLVVMRYYCDCVLFLRFDQCCSLHGNATVLFYLTVEAKAFNALC